MSSKYMDQSAPTELAVGNPQLQERQQSDACASLGWRETSITVEQVIERTKEWVSRQAEQVPAFLGAHLMGGITSMALSDPFPTYRDVDLHMILKDGSDMPGENTEVLYNGLMIEAGFRQQKEYRTPEVVLADPVIASHMAVPSILSDPTGFLSPLYEVVSCEYARRKWVQARCEAEKREALDKLETISHVPDPDPLTAYQLLGYAGIYVAAVLSLASLKAITSRRSYVQMRLMLESLGRADLYDRLLKVVGFGQPSREQAERYLQDAASAFDLAVKVKRSPDPFGYKMHAHLRPYLVGGSKEMMDEGFYREAAGWTMAFYGSSMQIIQTDAPLQLTSTMQAQFDEWQQTRKPRRVRPIHDQPLVEVPFQLDELAYDVDIVQAQHTRANQGAPDYPRDDCGDRQDMQDFDQAVESHGSLPMGVDEMNDMSANFFRLCESSRVLLIPVVWCIPADLVGRTHSETWAGCIVSCTAASNSCLT